jgi:hypothetical protein
VVIGAILLAIGVLVLAVGVAVIVVRSVPVVWLVIVLSAGAAYLAFTCRLLVIGTYVSAEGLRIRRPLRTLAFDWSSVLAVRSQKVTRTASGPPLVVTTRQACVDLTDGQTVELPVYGAMRGARRPWRMPDVLPAGEFDRVLAELRHLTAVHQTQDREQAPS